MRAALGQFGQLLAGIVSYVTEQLRGTYNELVDQNGRGWSGSDDISPEVMLDRINSLRHEVCTASEQFNNVANTLTLRQYRDFLVETSAALKDVVIVGADILLATTDITLLTAAKSGFSIFTGVRSLGSRIGRYAERVSEFFNAQ